MLALHYRVHVVNSVVHLVQAELPREAQGDVVVLLPMDKALLQLSIKFHALSWSHSHSLTAIAVGQCGKGGS